MENKSYGVIANRILDALDKGVLPWRKPWESLSPCSVITGKPYRGINRILLSMSPYADPRWVTFGGALKLGGHVRAGAKSQTIAKYVVFDRIEDGEDGKEVIRRITLMRTYAVFNVKQCDGLNLPELTPTITDGSIIDKVGNLIAGYTSAPRVVHGGDTACYSPRDDTVRVPSPVMFDVPEEYACTITHELIHSTGHFSRLNRLSNKQMKFGDEEYSREELIAEIGAAFLCADMQIDGNGVFDNSVAYIQSWRNAISRNHNLIIQASSAAERAARYIIGSMDAEQAHTSARRQVIAKCA